MRMREERHNRYRHRGSHCAALFLPVLLSSSTSVVSCLSSREQVPSLLFNCAFAHRSVCVWSHFACVVCVKGEWVFASSLVSGACAAAALRCCCVVSCRSRRCFPLMLSSSSLSWPSKCVRTWDLAILRTLGSLFIISTIFRKVSIRLISSFLLCPSLLHSLPISLPLWLYAVCTCIVCVCGSFRFLVVISALCVSSILKCASSVFPYLHRRHPAQWISNFIAKTRKFLTYSPYPHPCSVRDCFHQISSATCRIHTALAREGRIVISNPHEILCFCFPLHILSAHLSFDCHTHSNVRVLSLRRVCCVSRVSSSRYSRAAPLHTTTTTLHLCGSMFESYALHVAVRIFVSMLYSSFFYKKVIWITNFANHH